MRRSEIWLMGTALTVALACWRGSSWLEDGAQVVGTFIMMGIILIDGLMITGFIASIWGPVTRARAFRRQSSRVLSPELKPSSGSPRRLAPSVMTGGAGNAGSDRTRSRQL